MSIWNKLIIIWEINPNDFYFKHHLKIQSRKVTYTHLYIHSLAEFCVNTKLRRVLVWLLPFCFRYIQNLYKSFIRFASGKSCKVSRFKHLSITSVNTIQHGDDSKNDLSAACLCQLSYSSSAQWWRHSQTLEQLPYCAGKPVHPTSTGNSVVFQPFSPQSAINCAYFRLVRLIRVIPPWRCQLYDYQSLGLFKPQHHVWSRWCLNYLWKTSLLFKFTSVPCLSGTAVFHPFLFSDLVTSLMKRLCCFSS